jgi:hypothetical protein
MPVLEISSLIPKRDTVDFGDGQTVEIKNWSELHALDMGYLANLQGKAQALIDEALEDGAGPEAQAERIAQLHEHLNATLRYVMPDVQPEMLDGLELSAKQGILNWWRSQGRQAPAEVPNAEGQG